LEEQTVRERDIEKKLTKAVKAQGGMCPKLISPGTDGMPDRLVLLPGSRIGFVEVKAPGKEPRPLQARRHRQLSDLGFSVFVLDDPGQIPGIIAAIGGGRLV
jgi:hypothetical protein